MLSCVLFVRFAMGEIKIQKKEETGKCSEPAALYLIKILCRLLSILNRE
jgi:hypothetical protein